MIQAQPEVVPFNAIFELSRLYPGKRKKVVGLFLKARPARMCHFITQKACVFCAKLKRDKKTLVRLGGFEEEGQLCKDAIAGWPCPCPYFKAKIGKATLAAAAYFLLGRKKNEASR